MIGSLKGEITLKTDKYLLIETGGVGYKVHVSPETLSKTGKDALLFIHTHVREDAIDLYGFLGKEELQFFEMLINVSSVGPKSALAILGIASIGILQKAISTGDIAYLTKVSGIGKKTAEKIIIELRDKLDGEMMEGSLGGDVDVIEALKSLGYSQNEAREALKKVLPEFTTTNSKIKEALKILGKQ